jgi:hypothetical protein
MASGALSWLATLPQRAGWGPVLAWVDEKLEDQQVG